MLITIVGLCDWVDCEEDATQIACGRNSRRGNDGHPRSGLYCQAHAIEVADEDSPEYINECPNCGCLSGVN